MTTETEKVPDDVRSHLHDYVQRLHYRADKLEYEATELRAIANDRARRARLLRKASFGFVLGVGVIEGQVFDDGLAGMERGNGVGPAS